MFQISTLTHLLLLFGQAGPFKLVILGPPQSHDDDAFF